MERIPKRTYAPYAENRPNWLPKLKSPLEQPRKVLPAVGPQRKGEAIYDYNLRAANQGGNRLENLARTEKQLEAAVSEGREKDATALRGKLRRLKKTGREVAAKSAATARGEPIPLSHNDKKHGNRRETSKVFVAQEKSAKADLAKRKEDHSKAEQSRIFYPVGFSKPVPGFEAVPKPTYNPFRPHKVSPCSSRPRTPIPESNSNFKSSN